MENSAEQLAWEDPSGVYFWLWVVSEEGLLGDFLGVDGDLWAPLSTMKCGPSGGGTGSEAGHKERVMGPRTHSQQGTERSMEQCTLAASYPAAGHSDLEKLLGESITPYPQCTLLPIHRSKGLSLAPSPFSMSRAPSRTHCGVNWSQNLVGVPRVETPRIHGTHQGHHLLSLSIISTM